MCVCVCVCVYIYLSMFMYNHKLIKCLTKGVITDYAPPSQMIKGWVELVKERKLGEIRERRKSSGH